MGEASEKSAPVLEQGAPTANTVVEIQIGGRFVWGLVAILGVVGIFAVGLFLGRQINGSQANAPLAQQAFVPQQQVPAQPFPQQPGQPFQVQPQQAPSGPVPQLPAGKDVPIGDAPRLAIPEIEATNYVFDFGDIGPEEKVEHQFTIKNIGTQPLVISDTKSS